MELELPQSCSLLYHQLRLYSNTELECSRFNTCRGGNEYSIRLDKDCELRPMSCTAGTCEDYNFETFTGCEEVTVSGATRWKCVKTYANNTQTCVYAANLQRPQENADWSKCYDAGTWDAELCDCVACKEKVQQESSCIHTTQVPSCPAPTTTTDYCYDYYSYLWKLYDEGMSVENDFLPKDPLNNLLTFGSSRHYNTIYMNSLRDSIYYKNYYSRNMYQGYQQSGNYSLPDEGVSVYATYVCQSRHNEKEVEQFMQRI